MIGIIAPVYHECFAFWARIASSSSPTMFTVEGGDMG